MPSPTAAPPAGPLSPAAAEPAAQPLAARLGAHLQALEQGLLEREAAARLLLAALAGEHVLLIGPPGTAKSALARRLYRAFDGARYFERLLTRFSTPEELFGPLSLKALEDDRYERLIDGYLPTAGIAFLDEVFKANSAILNALLTLLNEREYDNGTARLRTPLISVVGASNEAPADESLLAFHDRFLLRVPVAPVGDAAFAALLQPDERDTGLPQPAPITAAERAQLLAARQGVALGDQALAALAGLRQQCAALGLPVSDRRWRQLVALMRCAAASEGRAALDGLDLWPAPFVVSPDAGAVPAVAQWLTTVVVQAVPQDLPWLDHTVTAFEKQLDLEQRLPDAAADFGDAQALTPLRTAVGTLGLAALCRGTDACAQQLLRTLLWHLDRLIDLQPRLNRDQAIAQVTQEFTAAWRLLKGDWDEVLALLQGLGDLGALRWDELRGQLSRREWAEAQRISQALRQLPELVALIRRLGRAERAATPPALPPHAQDAAQPRQLGLKAVQTCLPDAPGELRGIRHSDRIDGMLGSEAAMLLHPVLHKLWRARRAEARLLTYDNQAVLVDWLPDPAQPPRQAPAPPPPEALERGPIIVCLDTSGSMRGGPETIAKAVVLQAMRTAMAEHRGCRLIAFGGPDEIVERELAQQRRAR